MNTLIIQSPHIRLPVAPFRTPLQSRHFRTRLPVSPEPSFCLALLCTAAPFARPRFCALAFSAPFRTTYPHLRTTYPHLRITFPHLRITFSHPRTFSMFGLFSRAKVSRLGDGVSGVVDLVESSGKVCAVKTYHSREAHESRLEFVERVAHEYQVLSKLHHGNIIQPLRLLVLFGTVKMQMELGSPNLYVLLRERTATDETLKTEKHLQKGDVRVECRVPGKHRARPLLREVFCLWRQLCLGIAYLHSHNWCHRDLKLENLVLVGHTLKIVDFQTAAPTDRKVLGLVGSPSYVAPETVASIHYFGAAADIWAMGIVLYYMATGRFPWKSAVWNDARYAGYIKDKTSMLAKLPQECVALVAAVLDLDPEKRPSAQEILVDPWVSSIKWCHGEEECGLHVLGAETKTDGR